MKTTDHTRILHWLSDGTWRCGTELSYLKQQLKSKQKKLMGIQMTHSIYRKDKRNLSVKDRDWLHLQFIKLVEKRGWICGGGAGFTDLNNIKDDDYVIVTPKHTIEKI